MDWLRRVFPTWECPHGHLIQHPTQICCLYIGCNVVHTGLIYSSPQPEPTIIELVGKSVIAANIIAGLTSHSLPKNCCACTRVVDALPASNPPYRQKHTDIAVVVHRIRSSFGLYHEALLGLLPEIIQLILQAICDI